MMGAAGLKEATQIAILNANYMAARLKDHYKVLYTGNAGTCAHEFILDLREYKASCGVTEADVAKRLADYSCHSPTIDAPYSLTLALTLTLTLETPAHNSVIIIKSSVIIIKSSSDPGDSCTQLAH